MKKKVRELNIYNGEEKVRELNIYNGAIRWRISTSVKVIRCIFVIALTVSEILMFQMSDLENLGQDHGVQQSQWSHSIANINLYKRILTFFAQNL